MKIRWYQQSTQGGKLSILLKKRLPSVAKRETVQAKYKADFDILVLILHVCYRFFSLTTRFAQLTAKYFA